MPTDADGNLIVSSADSALLNKTSSESRTDISYRILDSSTDVNAIGHYGTTSPYTSLYFS